MTFILIKLISFKYLNYNQSRKIKQNKLRFIHDIFSYNYLGTMFFFTFF